jgi:hypothetical protein
VISETVLDWAELHPAPQAEGSLTNDGPPTSAAADAAEARRSCKGFLDGATDAKE